MIDIKVTQHFKHYFVCVCVLLFKSTEENQLESARVQLINFKEIKLSVW